MDIFLAQLVCGLSIGFIYAMVATCYNLLALVTGMLHWAAAHLLVLSMYIAWIVFGLTGNNLILGIAAAIVSSTLMSAVIAPIFQPFIRQRAVLEGFTVSMGLSLVIVDITSHWLHYGLSIAFPPALIGEGFIKFGLSTLSRGQVLTLVVSIVVVFIFFYFLNRTKQGRVLRAVAQDSDVARILGIPVGRIAILSFALSGLMAGVAAVLLAMSLGSASPGLGDDLGVKCMAILLFGSIGNLKGGLICALILGVAESMTIGYLPGQWSNAVAFSMIMVVLIFKPQGLFGVQR